MSKVYDVASLATHWGCGTDTVYNLVRSGELQSFKLGGKLIRIRAEEVERYECRSLIPSNDTGEASPSFGGRTASAGDIRLERLIHQPPRQPRGASGKAATSASR